MEKYKSYTSMQKNVYDNEGMTGNMNRENHISHNANPDYWNILVSDIVSGKYINGRGIDFGCGCGRNILNLIEKTKYMDGVDISQYLLDATADNLNKKGISNDKYTLYLCDGVSLKNIPSDHYDFVMSTIVLQHICVYDIRFSYLSDFYRILKTDGFLTFQMGYGTNCSHFKSYYENGIDAQGTNGACDVYVSNPQELIDDLTKIGYRNIEFTIRPSYDDPGHPEWIFVKAYK